MLHQLLQLLPNRLMHCVPVALVWGTVVGMLLWLLGGRFSRSMLTLLAVTAGSWVGIRLPQFFGWAIDPACVAVCGAIVGGTTAYLFHRTLIGIGLGAVAALWTVTAVWIMFGGPDQWHPPHLHWTGSLVTYFTMIWQSFPGKLGIVLPYALGAGLASGILTGVLWPRLGRCLLYSLIGTTLLLVTGLPLTARLRPNWLELAPTSGQTQILMLLGFVALGAAAQWCLTREPGKLRPEGSACGVADQLRPSAKDSQALPSPNCDAASGSPARERKTPLKRTNLAQCRPVVPLPVR